MLEQRLALRAERRRDASGIRLLEVVVRGHLVAEAAEVAVDARLLDHRGAQEDHELGLAAELRPVAEQLAEQRDARAAFWCAVRKLPDEFRSVLIMRLVDELSYVEIVEATGLPIGTVKSRLARARERLADLLAAELG